MTMKGSVQLTRRIEKSNVKNVFDLRKCDLKSENHPPPKKKNLFRSNSKSQTSSSKSRFKSFSISIAIDLPNTAFDPPLGEPFDYHMKQETEKVDIMHSFHQKMIPWWFAPNQFIENESIYRKYFNEIILIMTYQRIIQCRSTVFQKR
jgi:hypothetical protein